jgi:hypothetical protein
VGSQSARSSKRADNDLAYAAVLAHAAVLAQLPALPGAQAATASGHTLRVRLRSSVLRTDEQAAAGACGRPRSPQAPSAARREQRAAWRARPSGAVLVLARGGVRAHRKRCVSRWWPKTLGILGALFVRENSSYETPEARF